MKSKKRSGALGKLLTGILFLVAAAVIGLLYLTEMAPVKYLAIAGGAALVGVIIVGILTWNFYHKGRFLIGLLLWFAMIMALVVGGMEVYKTRSTLTDITGVETEIAQVGVYVKTEDSAQSLEDAVSYTYGTLKDLDRENTDSAIRDIDSQLGREVAVAEYPGLAELVDSLMSGETQAIVLNSAFLDVVKDLDGYAGLDSMIRQLSENNVETAIAKAAAPETESGKEQTDRDRSLYVIYISGIDARGGIVAKSRSDVNLLLVANMDTKQMVLINTPRDYYVPLSISNGVPDKLAHAGIYGVSVCMDTIGMLYDIDISQYVRLNLGGLADIVDAVGGVTIYSDHAFDTKDGNGYHFDQGENFVNGEQALAFLRERFSSGEGGLQSGGDQMEVIKGVLEKLGTADALSNYSELLAGLSGTFETNLSYEEIAWMLQMGLTEASSWNVVSCSVDGEEDVQKPYSLNQETSVLIPDESTVDHAKELIGQVMNGGTV